MGVRGQPPSPTLAVALGSAGGIKIQDCLSEFPSKGSTNWGQQLMGEAGFKSCASLQICAPDTHIRNSKPPG